MHLAKMLQILYVKILIKSSNLLTDSRFIHKKLES